MTISNLLTITNLNSVPLPLKTCSTLISIPVSWGDMNAGQHVSNTAYFRYFEDARVHFLEQIDFVQHDLKRDMGILLGSISCKFKMVLTYPDTLSIGTKIFSIQKDRFSMQHLVFSHKHQKLVAEGEAVIVTYDYKRECKIDIPNFLINNINNLRELE